MDGPTKVAAEPRGRPKEGDVRWHGGFLVSKKKKKETPNLRMPLALIISVKHNRLPPRHGDNDMCVSPYTNWCLQIVDPKTELTNQELSMFEDMEHPTQMEAYRSTLQKEFAEWQKICKPIGSTDVDEISDDEDLHLVHLH